MNKVVVTAAHAPHGTIKSAPATYAPTKRLPAGLHELVPPILQRMLPVLAHPHRPLSEETVQRILTKLVSGADYHGKTVLGVYGPRLVDWGMLPDGTTVAIVEDFRTAIRHMWSLDNETFQPVSYGMVDA